MASGSHLHYSDEEIVVDSAMEDAGSEEIDVDESMSDCSMASFDSRDTRWSSASIASSVLNYEYENGRRYHGYRAGAYWAPNDERHNEFLDLFHHVVALSLGGDIFTAPIRDPTHILDIGCGSGTWAMDMADRFPRADVLGIDLSPTQPSWTPANCRFEIDDADCTWVRPKNHYSFIHSRVLFGSISDWEQYITEIYDHLEPGGWTELVECVLPYRADDGSLTPEHHLYKWAQFMVEAGNRTGKSFDVAVHLKGWLEAKGFINVTEKTLKIPIGIWPADRRLKTIGHTNLICMLEGLDGINLAPFTRVLGWTAKQVQEFTQAVKDEMVNPRVHCYYALKFVCGQKPFDDDNESVSTVDSDAQSFASETEKMRSQFEIQRIDEDAPADPSGAASAGPSGVGSKASTDTLK